ncbi:hypothetical protein [Mycolicibacterium fluoranthenivorans]|uniref:hypothetical protein n=1 Tax=Mycolicibacterium fluoranthenivorans TaxID=258505 RepID=UPI00111339D9|nr:hypothetical protein [Mycolicibacterium fluoranthenivorans]
MSGDDLVRRGPGRWAERSPTHCPNGHELGPGRTLVGWRPCMCGGHRTWTCRTCDTTAHRPPLQPACDAD